MDREILIFIWHENSFALLALRLLSPRLPFGFGAFFCIFVWMDGWMDGWEAQSRIGENITGKRKPFGGVGDLHMINNNNNNNNSVVPTYDYIYFFFFFLLVWFL